MFVLLYEFIFYIWVNCKLGHIDIKTKILGPSYNYPNLSNHLINLVHYYHIIISTYEIKVLIGNWDYLFTLGGFLFHKAVELY
jgi:hypothetical protein